MEYSGCFISIYGFFRFFIEFFREPDQSYWITLFRLFNGTVSMLANDINWNYFYNFKL